MMSNSSTYLTLQARNFTTEI